VVFGVELEIEAIDHISVYRVANVSPGGSRRRECGRGHVNNEHDNYNGRTEGPDVDEQYRKHANGYSRQLAVSRRGC